MELLDKKIEKIHNYIYANDGLSNSETLNEFLKIFYCKILDEQDGNKLSSLLKPEDIISRINELYDQLKIRLNTFIEPKEKINLKQSTILFIIEELKEIKLNAISPDTKGHILQKIIDRSYRESRGQFFTPIPVVDFIVKMIRPRKGELGCDPASGTGGFMFTALEYISENEKIDNSQLKNIYFFDISKSLIKLIAMRMMFEFSNSESNYTVKDSIAEDFSQRFDYVLTNPPFGSQGKITDPQILNKYDLSQDGDKTFKTQVPDILFVEKVIKILKNGGRSAIVLPDGDFENPTQEYFRKYLIDNVKIDAIVSLPDGTFIPYGTGVKSSIIFFTKLASDEVKKEIDNNYKVFFGKITKLGYTISKHSKDLLTKDGRIDEDYSDVLDSYFSRKYNDNCYTVDIQTIINDKNILSENHYSPIYSRKIDKIKEGNYALLKDIVKFNYSKTRISDDVLYKYIEIADVNSYTGEIINCSEMLGEELPSRASFKLNTQDIIVATSGNAIGTSKQTKAIISDFYSGSICTNGFTVMKAVKYSPYFMLNFFSSDAFLSQVLKYKYGTAIPCIGKEDFENILVPIPDDATIEKIENRVKKSLELREEAMKLMQAIE